MEHDQLAHILAQWQAARPDLDTAPMGVIGRVLLAAVRLQARLNEGFARHSLTMGSFDVLASLRRAGPSYQLSPTQLYRELLLSSGGMTHRMNRLEQQGLVERLPDPADRRGMLVRLTPAGRVLTDQLLEEHLAAEREILSALEPAEQQMLGAILTKLLASLEASSGAKEEEEE